MNATPPAEKPPAPQADAVSQGYAKKAETIRGSKKMSDKLEAVGAIAEAISLEVQKVIIGKAHVIDNVMVNILANGNLLFEDYPGLAKTLMTNTFADALGCDFKRVQFTPDLLPADITGTNIYDAKKGEFSFKPGPIFCNLLLSDEINRAPPKTQAALLEAMQEKQVTIGVITHKLPAPFLTMATQNPVEQEGTYPLPEAQLDRFMFNTWVDYPTFEEELNVVKQTTGNMVENISPVMSGEEILNYQKLIRRMPVADNVLNYAVSLASKTRPGRDKATKDVDKYLSWGAGPRASQFLIIGAKVHAALEGKYSPDIEDVKAVSLSILRHRIVTNYKAEADGITVGQLISDLT